MKNQTEAEEPDRGHEGGTSSSQESQRPKHMGGRWCSQKGVVLDVDES